MIDTVYDEHPSHVCALSRGIFSIYALAELARFKFWRARAEYFYVKAVLVLVGFGGALGGSMVYGPEGMVYQQTQSKELKNAHFPQKLTKFWGSGIMI